MSVLNVGQTSSSPKAKEPTKAKSDEFLGARIKFAELLQEIYRKEGRPIAVKAIGDNRQTLDLFSVLVSGGTYALDAAKRAAVNFEYSMAIIRRSRFKQIIIHGGRYSESYAVK
jgi:hypothetical protein